jgi:hypothetical protein
MPIYGHLNKTMAHLFFRRYWGFPPVEGGVWQMYVSDHGIEYAETLRLK